MFFEPIERPKLRSVQAFGAGALLCLSVTGAAQAAPASATAGTQLHAAWRAAISRTALPGKGCFTATYPATIWTQVACTAAPDRDYAPGHAPVAGGGNDFAAAVSNPVSTAVGSFPTITGLKSEKNVGASDQYSLQLNTQYFTTPACAGSQYPPQCDGWQQFIFAQGGGRKGTSSAFMVYWVINYGPVCPTGWNQAALNCWIASSAVSVPHQKLSALGDLQLSGTVVSGGNDTVQLTTSSKAYAESGLDSMLSLAGAWKQTEFNVLGDGHGSQANFNSGTTIDVNIELTDGSTTAPTCRSGAIFTNETNNLNLGSCTGQAGKNPSIAFKESN
jgi:hypothetical protein